MTIPAKNNLAVISALLAMLAIGLLYLPLENLIADKYLVIFGPSNPTYDLIFISSLFLWAIIPSFTGGWVAAAIAASRPLKRAVVAGLIACLLFDAIYLIVNSSDLQWPVILFSLLPIPFASIGGWVGNKVKIRRANKRAQL